MDRSAPLSRRISSGCVSWTAERRSIFLAVWTVRVFMLVILISAARKRGGRELDVFRTASAIAVAGMICTVTLGSTDRDRDPGGRTWRCGISLSVILMFSVLVYNLNRHYEAEKEIVRLKEEQAELLDRDYQSLNRLYSENARLFHDLHNHIELLHRHLTHGNVNEAVEYLEDLRGPVREITNSGWTGDEAVDYLIGNKTPPHRSSRLPQRSTWNFPGIPTSGAPT